MENPIKIIPLIRLMSWILCGVSLFLILPASITLVISALNTISKQTTKMSMRSFMVWLIKEVDAVNQNKNTEGFNVFIKYPERNMVA